MIEKEFKLGQEFPRIDFETWRAAVEKEVKAPFEKRMVSQTYEGFALQPLYTEDLVPHRGRSVRPSRLPALYPRIESRSAPPSPAGTSGRSTLNPIRPN